LNGQLLVVWDVKDEKGTVVPNSFYHVLVESAFADGTKGISELDVYVGSHGKLSTVQFTAHPNVAHAGDLIHISAAFGGSGADNRSLTRIYTVNGEKVRTLTFTGGQVSWDLTNDEGQAVASGLYLLCLEGLDELTHQPVHKTIKVAVFR